MKHRGGMGNPTTKEINELDLGLSQVKVKG